MYSVVPVMSLRVTSCLLSRHRSYTGIHGSCHVMSRVALSISCRVICPFVMSSTCRASHRVASLVLSRFEWFLFVSCAVSRRVTSHALCHAPDNSSRAIALCHGSWRVMSRATPSPSHCHVMLCVVQWSVFWCHFTFNLSPCLHCSASPHVCMLVWSGTRCSCAAKGLVVTMVVIGLQLPRTHSVERFFMALSCLPFFILGGFDKVSGAQGTVAAIRPWTRVKDTRRRSTRRRPCACSPGQTSWDTVARTELRPVRNAANVCVRCHLAFVDGSHYGYG